MTNTLEMKKSYLVLPTSGYELDREEMSYVEGGGQISLAQLKSDANQWLALGIAFSATAVAASLLAAIFYSVPFGLGIPLGIAATLDALAATISATLCFSSYSNAINAINLVSHYVAMGRSYKIYKYESGGIASYIVE